MTTPGIPALCPRTVTALALTPKSSTSVEAAAATPPPPPPPPRTRNWWWELEPVLGTDTAKDRICWSPAGTSSLKRLFPHLKRASPFSLLRKSLGLRFCPGRTTDGGRRNCHGCSEQRPVPHGAQSPGSCFPAGLRADTAWTLVPQTLPALSVTLCSDMGEKRSWRYPKCTNL